jgi:hypothetical protein
MYITRGFDSLNLKHEEDLSYIPLPFSLACDQIPCPFTGDKASNGVGLKSVQAGGCPMSMLNKMSILT